VGSEAGIAEEGGVRVSIPAADLPKLTDDDVWVELHHGMIDSPMHPQAILTLRLNNLDRQTRASRELVDSADTLVSKTARLADFTRPAACDVGSGRSAASPVPGPGAASVRRLPRFPMIAPVYAHPPTATRKAEITKVLE
jgi:hypothetical protein